MNCPFAVEFKNISKQFGPTRANDNLNFQIRRGSIHGLIGENGAGKSTAMKILYGLYKPDNGELLIHGEKKQWNSPREAIQAGIGMVHQHFMLAEGHSVLDNIILGAEETPFLNDSITPLWSKAKRWMGFIDRSSIRVILEKISKQYGLSIPFSFDALIETLPVGIQQKVEIIKLLYRESNILILDEPTAVLTPQEVEDLFVNLKRLKDEGKTIIIISHKLKEVLALTDEVTVFRKGQVVRQITTSETNQQQLADWMVGKSVRLQIPEKNETTKSQTQASLSFPNQESREEEPIQSDTTQILLKLTNLSIHRKNFRPLKNISFEVKAGEIVGIAGVEGNGQSELLKTLLHPKAWLKYGTGNIEFFGKLANDLTAFDLKEMGLAFIPEDRQQEGLLLDSSCEENFLLGFQRSPQFAQYGIIKQKNLTKEVQLAFEQFDIRPRLPLNLSKSFSGGNQQKLIIARELHQNPKLIIAAQPTRGVDVGAIEFIHQKLIDLKASGAAILLISSELEEIMSLSDRLFVLYSGQLVKEFKKEKSSPASQSQIGLYMGGGSSFEDSLKKEEPMCADKMNQVDKLDKKESLH